METLASIIFDGKTMAFKATVGGQKYGMYVDLCDQKQDDCLEIVARAMHDTIAAVIKGEAGSPLVRVAKAS